MALRSIGAAHSSHRGLWPLTNAQDFPRRVLRALRALRSLVPGKIKSHVSPLGRSARQGKNPL